MCASVRVAVVVTVRYCICNYYLGKLLMLLVAQKSFKYKISFYFVFALTLFFNLLRIVPVFWFHRNSSYHNAKALATRKITKIRLTDNTCSRYSNICKTQKYFIVAYYDHGYFSMTSQVKSRCNIEICFHAKILIG